MTRRVIALGVGLLVLILVLLGIKGCLNARKERGFDNYVSDVTSIATQSNQLSTDFFTRLEEPPKGEKELTLEAQIASDRGTADNLLQRTENLSTPDELSEPQGELVETMKLRRDALAGIADDIPTALGDTGRSAAIQRMVDDMKAFLASDVLYARAHDNINSVLADQGISGEIPASQFLPEPIDRWLDDLQLTTVLSTFASTAGTVTGVHGLAVLGTSVNKTALTADAATSVSLGSGPPTLTVQVQNQGDQAESDVTVSYTISGGAVPISGDGSITQLDAQGTQELALDLTDQPETGVPLTLVVEVLPVPGEEVVDNNKATYTVTFN